MTYYISSILIGQDEQYNFINNLPLQEEGLENNEWLSNLSKINIFLGSNNSGKSNLMRKIIKIPQLNFIPHDKNFLEIYDLIIDLGNLIDSILNRYQIADYAGIKNQYSHLEKSKFVIEELNNIQEYISFLEILINISGTPGVGYNAGDYYKNFNNHDRINDEFNELGSKYKKTIESLVEDAFLEYKFKRVYIPTLRGLRTLEENNSDWYKNRTIKDYFSGMEFDTVFTGLNLYRELQNLLLGSLNDREKVVEYQKFLGETFFNGEPITLIPSIGSDVVTVKIGQEKELKIHELGDGIQSIIIQTFPLFANMNENMLIFIEEPELYLHPGLQRKLLETFMLDEFSGFQFFLTTHSNHLLDVTLDLEKISIYSFKKELETNESREKKALFTVENVSNEENDLLDMLGVQNSSVYLSNCTIWVEGITDRYYVRRYLKLYQDYLNILEKDRLREDYHYSFVEYSGNNITHWSFLDDNNDEDFSAMNVERLCSKLFLIADKDSDKKLPRQQQLKENLGDRFYCLDCKEIENLIDEDILKKVISEYEGKNVGELEFNRKFTRKTYKNNYLGQFIDKQLKDSKRKNGYSSKSGTIKDKINFFKKALNYIKTYDDLSEEAKSLAEQVYKFVYSKNKNKL